MSIGYFDGEDVHDAEPQLCTTSQIIWLETLWGKVSHEIPKHIRNNMEVWITNMTTLTYQEAEQLIAELRGYLPNEPVTLTEINKHIKNICTDAPKSETDNR